MTPVKHIRRRTALLLEPAGHIPRRLPAREKSENIPDNRHFCRHSRNRQTEPEHHLRRLKSPQEHRLSAAVRTCQEYRFWPPSSNVTSFVTIRSFALSPSTNASAGWYNPFSEYSPSVTSARVQFIPYLPQSHDKPAGAAPGTPPPARGADTHSSFSPCAPKNVSPRASATPSSSLSTAAVTAPSSRRRSS